MITIGYLIPPPPTEKCASGWKNNEETRHVHRHRRLPGRPGIRIPRARRRRRRADQGRAREWLHDEFDELECTPSNPVGKVLVLDVILNVAKYGGEQRFAQGGEWARQFAAASPWRSTARRCASTCPASWWAEAPGADLRRAETTDHPASPIPNPIPMKPHPWWKGRRGEWYVALQAALFALSFSGRAAPHRPGPRPCRRRQVCRPRADRGRRRDFGGRRVPPRPQPHAPAPPEGRLPR
jgi:hypothetical protein